MAGINAEELQAFAINAGVVTAGSDLTLDYGRVLASVVAELEVDTGYTPFLAQTQTRALDMPWPDGKILDLKGGLVSLTSFTLSGTTLTQNQDFWLYPLNAANVGKPYTWIEFAAPYRQYWPWMVPAQISITGVWGFAASYPDDVKHALLCKACSDLISIKAGAATGSVTSIQQGDVKVSYQGVQNATGLTAQQLQLEEAYGDVVKRYRRLRVL